MCKQKLISNKFDLKQTIRVLHRELTEVKHSKSEQNATKLICNGDSKLGSLIIEQNNVVRKQTLYSKLENQG